VNVCDTFGGIIKNVKIDLESEIIFWKKLYRGKPT